MDPLIHDLIFRYLSHAQPLAKTMFASSHSWHLLLDLFYSVFKLALKYTLV